MKPEKNLRYIVYVCFIKCVIHKSDTVLSCHCLWSPRQRKWENN